MKTLHTSAQGRNTGRMVPVLVIIAGLFWAGPAEAQVTKVGTTAAKFLSVPVGARALGMGGAFAGLANDASALYWNPAGVARLQNSEALFDHTNWIADISFNYGAVVMPLTDVGTVGLSFTSMNMGEMERTTEEMPEGTGTKFSASSIAIGLSYARNLTDWFSLGFTAKYVNEGIWNSAATAFALDVGTLFTTPFEGLKFGAGISNFGEKMHIQGDDLLVQKDISGNQGNNPNINANLGTDRFDLPLTLRIGFAYEPIANESEHLVIAVDALHPNDNAESVNIGGEFSVLDRMLSIRGGYAGLGLDQSEEQFTLGGGLRYGLEGGLVFKVDYAFQKFGRLNDVHKFSASVEF